MKKTVSTAAVLVAILLAGLFGPVTARPQEKDAGIIEKVEVSSVSRESAAFWVRAVVPKVAKGWRQTFVGEIKAGGIVVPVQKPVTVAVQPRSQGFETVFILNVDLAKLPADILPKAGARPFEAVLSGTLTGDEESRVNVSAAATLAFGTPQVEVPMNNIPAFFRFDGASLSGLSFTEVKGEARVVLYNPLSFDVSIKEFRYQLVIGEKALASGTKTGVRLHNRRENTVTIPISVKNSDLVSAAGTTVRNKGTVEGRLSGSVTVRAGGEDIVLSFNSPGTVQLLP